MAARPLPCAPRCQGGSALLPNTPQARRATQAPSTHLGKVCKAFSQPVQGLCSPLRPAKGWQTGQRSPWGCGKHIPDGAHFLFPEEGQSCLGSRPRAVGAHDRARRVCKVSQPNPNSPWNSCQHPSRALPSSCPCQGLLHKWEVSGKRRDMCHPIRESPWYSRALSPNTSPVSKVQVSPYFSFYFSAPPKRSLKGFCLLQASALMGMTHQHS